MKLAEWAKKQGISYLTAYRWFKDGKLPAEAYQSESGTIIVKDDELEASEQMMKEDTDSNAVAHFLKKTVEFSKSNSTVEDFAAYVLSNYKLEIQGAEKLSKQKTKPTPEMTSNHFQKYLQKSKKPEPNMFLLDKESLEEIVANPEDPNLIEKLKKANIVEQPVTKLVMTNPVINSIASEMQGQINVASASPSAMHTYDGMTAGVFSRTESQNYGSVIDSAAPATFSSSKVSYSDDDYVFNLMDAEASKLYSNTSINESEIIKKKELANAAREELRKRKLEEFVENKDKKIFTNQGLYLAADYHRTYDEARKLTDLMIEAGLLPKNDNIIIDRQAKEICGWPETTFNAMKTAAEDKVAANKKVVKKGRKGKK